MIICSFHTKSTYRQRYTQGVDKQGIFYCIQRGVTRLQHPDGLHNVRVRDVELRRDGHDRDPLEGPPAAATGLPHLHRGADGARLHQVPARMDHLGCARRYIHLG